MGDAEDPRPAEGDRENDPETIAEETANLVASGSGAGNRAGGFAFLAVILAIATGMHFHFSDRGGDSFSARLDADLLSHAEFSLASGEGENRLAVVPDWPLGLYWRLRRDAILYAALAFAAAVLWGWSVRARARRDAWLVYKKLSAELADLRRDREKSGRNGEEKKG